MAIINFFIRLFYCWWKGHDEGYGLNTDRIWIKDKRFERIRCMMCDKVLRVMPLLPSGRRYMRIKVEVIEGVPDGLSDV